jgi:glucose-6-phosphate 1-dehydrogenase
MGESNHLRFRLNPEIVVALGARAKKAGEAFAGEPTELVACYNRGSAMQPYERLLGDAMRGDATLFAREDSVEAAWRVVDPILKAQTPVSLYDPGTWGPPEADALIAPDGDWHNPVDHDPAGMD